jgi:hypothetical protein
MPQATEDELVGQLEAKARRKLAYYLATNELRNNWDGSNRLDDAANLLSCAAMLRASTKEQQP